jgi:peptide/nickel transport system substrate-binding protein
MRPPFSLLVLTAFLLVACVAETPVPLPTASPVPAYTHTSIPPAPVLNLQRAHVLRVALLGDVSTTNVWALFDEEEDGYWNLATQAGYWPSLYRLAPPALDLWPVTAKGEPTLVNCDTGNCMATVTLQPGLTWTDGSVFSSEDVVFTINTTLQFQLGLNWQQFYNPDVIDHAEALDELTVKLYFKSYPSLTDWQYGVLLGPVVNRAYWQPRVIEVASLLPDEALLATIRELEAELAWRQAELNGVSDTLTEVAPEYLVYLDTARQANRMHNDLVGVANKLEKKRAEYETKLAEARAVLFALDNIKEPTLGPWKFANHDAGIFENRANFDTPFGNPWFDSVRYVTYPDEWAAVEALVNNQVDLILTPYGLSYDAVARLEGEPGIALSHDITRSSRFLAFNHANPYLADPTLHRSLACMLDPAEFAVILNGEAKPLPGFVLDEFWQNKTDLLPCTGSTGNARLVEAIKLLKAAGYSWENEPASGQGGKGLRTPDGNVFPGFTLLTPQQDPIRSLVAQYIVQKADLLGLELVVALIDSDDLLYRVYSSGNYDMALLGWRLSAYPSYLCDWFMPFGQNPFAYNGSNHRSTCESWAQINHLNVAKAYAFEAQSILMKDLPLVPLYVNVRVDAYRNVRYPFPAVIDGLGGLYGAPGLAIPLP